MRVVGRLDGNNVLSSDNNEQIKILIGCVELMTQVQHGRKAKVGLFLIAAENYNRISIF